MGICSGARLRHILGLSARTGLVSGWAAKLAVTTPPTPPASATAALSVTILACGRSDCWGRVCGRCWNVRRLSWGNLDGRFVLGLGLLTRIVKVRIPLIRPAFVMAPAASAASASASAPASGLALQALLRLRMHLVGNSLRLHFHGIRCFGFWRYFF